MNLASPLGLDWGALALTAVIVGGLIWALLFFLRKNREDYRSMLNDLKSQTSEDDSGDDAPADDRSRRG